MGVYFTLWCYKIGRTRLLKKLYYLNEINFVLFLVQYSTNSGRRLQPFPGRTANPRLYSAKANHTFYLYRINGFIFAYSFLILFFVSLLNLLKLNELYSALIKRGAAGPSRAARAGGEGFAHPPPSRGSTAPGLLIIILLKGREPAEPAPARLRRQKSTFLNSLKFSCFTP